MSADFTVGVSGMNARPDNPGPGLAVARCLRAAFGPDVRIVGFGYDALDPGLYLPEVCDAGYLVPYPSAGEEALWARLQEIHAREHLDALIPCLDAELPSFARLAPRLRDLGVRMLVPDPERLRARDKDRLAELAEQVGLQTPRTEIITQAQFFYRCHEEGWRYPLVVKGVFYDAIVVQTPEEGVQAFRRIAAQWGHPVLVQPYIAGHEVNLAAIGDGEGALIAPVMARKQATTEKGKGWSCVTIHDPVLLDAARRLARELRWQGPCEVEMLRAEDGTSYLVEINPRFPAWIYLSVGAERNLPALLVRMLQGERVQTEEPAPAGVIMIRYAWETIVDLAAFESVSMRGERLHNKEER